ncbi:MAG: phosphoribosylglycinamide synthetase C domain-containing protein, partial [Candidatus Margulisiibacteriota bacterium]
ASLFRACPSLGDTMVPMDSAQDHKAIFDGDQGPNTGGMGAYSPAPVVTPAVMELIHERVLDRILKGFAKEGIVFRGVLFVGLMIDKGEPFVLEFNVRFGDPETQVVLPRLKTDLFSIMEAVCLDRLNQLTLEWVSDPAVCVVMASKGYPGAYETGKEISGLDRVQELVFHAGTKRLGGRLVSSGGRVLAVTALAPTLPMAIHRAYAGVDQISFSNQYCRTDIGQKALRTL